uniref:Peptidyl-prolyl cis-trans isomerase n=1 Tax=Phaeomonas parva TaxID=124430 RepID=A0A7S1TT63_9STRA|mmetsp:Transcript_14726/g.44292  ORF Transcript_14726/g.44292 Transcript_14726/m.44292 type:complete len:154 (+) Transcript_14726:101-562(+)
MLRTFLLALFLGVAAAFAPPVSRARSMRLAPMSMGFFDGFKKVMEGAFENKQFTAPPPGTVARASHVLVKTEEQCLDIKRQIEEGADFGDMAMQYSTCPSKNRGGDLGNFKPGMMVSEFDDVVFDEGNDIGAVLGPVQTKFGYHLVKIIARSM